MDPARSGPGCDAERHRQALGEPCPEVVAARRGWLVCEPVQGCGDVRASADVDVLVRGGVLRGDLQHVLGVVAEQRDSSGDHQVAGMGDLPGPSIQGQLQLV